MTPLTKSYGRCGMYGVMSTRWVLLLLLNRVWAAGVTTSPSSQPPLPPPPPLSPSLPRAKRPTRVRKAFTLNLYFTQSGKLSTSASLPSRPRPLTPELSLIPAGLRQCGTTQSAGRAVTGDSRAASWPRAFDTMFGLYIRTDDDLRRNQKTSDDHKHGYRASTTWLPGLSQQGIRHSCYSLCIVL